MNGWIYLTLGILFEVAGTFSMKLSGGFERFLPSVLFVVFFAISLSLINLSMKTLDMSVAYAVWCGVGIFLITLLGIWWLDEPVTFLRLLFLSLIVVGVVGLKLVDGKILTG